MKKINKEYQTVDLASDTKFIKSVTNNTDKVIEALGTWFIKVIIRGLKEAR